MKITGETQVYSQGTDELLYIDAYTDDGDILRVQSIGPVVSVTRLSDWTTLARKAIPDWKVGTAATPEQIMSAADLAGL